MVKQRGISLVGILCVAVVLAGAGVLGAQVATTAMEYHAISKAARKAEEGATATEARAIFDRAQAIDDFSAVSGDDLAIVVVNDRLSISFAYSREIHLFGPAFITLKYRGGAS